MFKLAIVVDAQIDFMSPKGALYVPGAEKVVPVLDEYLGECKLENGYVGVLFTADTHDEETYPESAEAKGDPENGIPAFPPHCLRGTDGFDLAVKAKNVPGETPKFILNKGVFDMWQENEVEVRPFKVEGELVSYGGEKTREEFFEHLKTAGVEEIEVSGVASDYCVKWAIQGLLSRGFKVTVYDNLVAGIERDIHQVVNEEFSGANIQVC